MRAVVFVILMLIVVAKDPYEVLGLRRGASEADVKK
jgi:preprotein translocase subunit Sec63